MNCKLFYSSQAFSLLTKVPKKVTVDQSKSWFSKLFTNNQNSATYVLLKELFSYLQSTNILQVQFPYLKNTQKFEENSMIVHVHLLQDRIKKQIDLPRSELQKYQYNLQAVFFPQFSATVNPAIPTKNFKEHFAQAYMKKLQIFSEQINDYEWNVDSNREVLQFEQYAPLFKKLVYEHRLNVENIQLIKFCKYYAAHKKYLSLLDWNDMISYQVKWGFESLKLINEVDRIHKEQVQPKK